VTSASARQRPACPALPRNAIFLSCPCRLVCLRSARLAGEAVTGRRLAGKIMPLWQRVCAFGAAGFFVQLRPPPGQAERRRSGAGQRRAERPLEGPPGAADNLAVVVGQAPPQAAERVEDGIAEQRLVFLRDQGAPVSREELLAQVGPSVPRAVLQADEVTDGRRRLRAFPVDDPAGCWRRVSRPPAWSRYPSTRPVRRLTSSPARGTRWVSRRRPSSPPACQCTCRSSRTLRRRPRTGSPGTAVTTMTRISGSAAASSGTRPGPRAGAQLRRAAISRAWKAPEEWRLRYQQPPEALASRHTAEVSRCHEQSVTSVTCPAT